MEFIFMGMDLFMKAILRIQLSMGMEFWHTNQKKWDIRGSLLKEFHREKVNKFILMEVTMKAIFGKDKNKV